MATWLAVVPILLLVSIFASTETDVQILRMRCAAIQLNRRKRPPHASTRRKCSPAPSSRRTRAPPRCADAPRVAWAHAASSVLLLRSLPSTRAWRARQPTPSHLKSPQGAARCRSIPPVRRSDRRATPIRTPAWQHPCGLRRSAVTRAAAAAARTGVAARPTAGHLGPGRGPALARRRRRGAPPPPPRAQTAGYVGLLGLACRPLPDHAGGP